MPHLASVLLAALLLVLVAAPTLAGFLVGRRWILALPGTFLALGLLGMVAFWIGGDSAQSSSEIDTGGMSALALIVLGAIGWGGCLLGLKLRAARQLR